MLCSSAVVDVTGARSAYAVYGAYAAFAVRPGEAS